MLRHSVRRDTQIFPLPVGRKNFVSVFFGRGVGITPEQEPQGWIGQRRDLDNSSGSFYRIPRLLTIVISLKADCSADCRVVLLPPFPKLRGGTRKIGSKATRFDDRDLYAERSNLFRQGFRKALDTELCCCICRTPDWSHTSADR